MRDGAGVGCRPQSIHPFPARLFPDHARDRADRNPLRVDPSESGGEHQRTHRHRIPVGDTAELERAFSDPGGRRGHHARRVARHGKGAHPKLRMRPRHDDAGPLGYAEHDADQPLGRDNRVEDRHAVTRSRAQEQGTAIGGLGLVEHFGGDVGTGKPAAEQQELAEAFVLGEERGEALGEVGGGVALGGDGAEPDLAGLALLGADLEPDQRCEDAPPERRCDAQPPAVGREEPHQGEAEADEERHGVPARVGAFRRAGHAQTERTLRYFS